MEIKVNIGTPLCNALLICLGELTHSQIEDWLRKQDEKGNMILDVNFTVNGVEANFENILDRLADSYDELVLSQVQKVLHKKYSEIMEKLDDVKYAIDNIDIDEFRQFRFEREKS